MAAPSRSLSVLDGQLGSIGPSAARTVWVIGSSSGGVAGTIYSFGGDNVQGVKTQLVSGRGPEVVSHILLKSEGRATVHYLEGAKSTAGTSSAVAQSGAGPLPTLSGAPTDDFQMKVEIMAGGAVGTSTFRYSKDNGKNWQPGTFATAASFPLGIGATAITFIAGTYVLGETYTWTATGPKNTNGDIGTALDIILASSLRGIGVYVTGAAATAGDAETICTTVASKLTSGLASEIFMRGFVEMPVATTASLVTGFSDFENSRVVAVLGYADIVSELTNGIVPKRNWAAPLVARVLRNGLSVDPSRNATDSDLESLAGVSVPDNQSAALAYHLEDQTPGADAGRFAYLMKNPPRGGVYAGNVKTMAAITSDFQLLQYGLVMDEGCRVTSDALLTFQSKKLRVDAVTGFIREDEARNIESHLGSKLRAALVQTGHAVEVVVTVARSDNLLADNTLRIKIRITPVAYAKTIEAEIGFRNPAIPLAEAA